MPKRRAAGTTTPKSSPKPNGCQPSASSIRSLHFRTTFSSIESTTAARITPSAPSTSRPLTSLPRTRLRETPPSKTTASVFCIEFITPVAPHRASPSVNRPARLQGEGTEEISVSSLATPSGERSNCSPIAETRSCWSTLLDERNSARIVATKVASGISEKSAR